jgi:hypothetical protein
MDPNASPEDQEVYAYYQNMMRNLHLGEQSGIITPSLKDDSGAEMIAEFELLGIQGTKSFDVGQIIGRYRNEIITSLMASQLVLGQDGGGSFSLAESLQGISDMAIESKLIEIQEQLNHDLIPQLFALNGWDTTTVPFFQFGDLKTPDLDVLSKFIQRVASVGLMAQDAQTVNWIASQANMPAHFDDTTIEVDEVRESLTGNSSGAGEGMSTAGPGTSKSPTGGNDTSVGNLENKSLHKSLEIISENADFVTAKVGDKTIKFMREDFDELTTENV